MEHNKNDFCGTLFETEKKPLRRVHPLPSNNQYRLALKHVQETYRMGKRIRMPKQKGVHFMADTVLVTAINSIHERHHIPKKELYNEALRLLLLAFGNDGSYEIENK